MNEIKINRKVDIVIPVFNGLLSFVRGQVFYINENLAIYVQDLDGKQNPKLFEEGLKLIDSKVSPKRKEYLVELLNTVLPKAEIDTNEIVIKSKPLVSVIAFVCDIALHNDKLLAHPRAYHKDFPKYVANLFYQYGLDDAYDVYHTMGVRGLSVIPQHLFKPVSKIA